MVHLKRRRFASLTDHSGMDGHVDSQHDHDPQCRRPAKEKLCRDSLCKSTTAISPEMEPLLESPRQSLTQRMTDKSRPVLTGRDLGIRNQPSDRTSGLRMDVCAAQRDLLADDATHVRGHEDWTALAKTTRGERSCRERS